VKANQIRVEPILGIHVHRFLTIKWLLDGGRPRDRSSIARTPMTETCSFRAGYRRIHKYISQSRRKTVAHLDQGYVGLPKGVGEFEFPSETVAQMAASDLTYRLLLKPIQPEGEQKNVKDNQGNQHGGDR